ncbi:hypothetical protein LCGC14_2795140 [marine sediment metagenome]|uniref:Uncharacterized protein n=1 Tax=marine sediment metagenome TaxID=412755 RepID=A0A0F9AY10_9ZZZZ
MENKNIKLVDGRVTKLCNIKAKPIPRNKTWFPDLDELYGRSDMPQGDELEFNNLGMPRGKISLWAGESGVGKSRLCIEVAKQFSIGYRNGTVLYIQTESPLEDFASWAKDTSKYNNIYCSGVETQKDIIDVIYNIKPKLIFIDSVNEVVDFIGNAKSSSRLIKGDDTVGGLKQAVYDVGAHLILLGQLNGDGKTIKGGTSLPHLVDIALSITWLDKPKGYFKVEVGVKHRYGSRKHVAYFQHTNDGVIACHKPIDYMAGEFVTLKEGDSEYIVLADDPKKDGFNAAEILPGTDQTFPKFFLDAPLGSDVPTQLPQ